MLNDASDNVKTKKTILNLRIKSNQTSLRPPNTVLWQRTSRVLRECDISPVILMVSKSRLHKSLISHAAWLLKLLVPPQGLAAISTRKYQQTCDFCECYVFIVFVLVISSFDSCPWALEPITNTPPQELECTVHEFTMAFTSCREWER